MDPLAGGRRNDAHGPDWLDKRGMNHVDIHRWIDCVRGLVGESERAAAEAHALSCASCRRTSAVLGGFASVVRAEEAYEVPPPVVQRALDIFDASARQPRGLTRLLTRLVYDSRREPLPAGVRSANRSSQVLYEADEFALDLQINQEYLTREGGVQRLILVGQIANRREPGVDMSGRPVLLLCGREVAARTLSNDLGEFHLESEPRRRMRLQVWVGGDRKIEIPVSRFTRAEES